MSVFSFSQLLFPPYFLSLFILFAGSFSTLSSKCSKNIIHSEAFSFVYLGGHFICKAEKQRRHRKNYICHSLAHSPNAHNSRAGRLKPGPKNSLSVLSRWQGPKYLNPPLLLSRVCISRKLKWKVYQD